MLIWFKKVFADILINEIHKMRKILLEATKLYNEILIL